MRTIEEEDEESADEDDFSGNEMQFDMDRFDDI